MWKSLSLLSGAALAAQILNFTFVTFIVNKIGTENYGKYATYLSVSASVPVFGPTIPNIPALFGSVN